MKKTHRYLLGIIILLISPFFFTAKFDLQYISNPAQEGEVAGVKLAAGKSYLQSFSTTRHSISELSLFLRPATTKPVTTHSIKLKVHRGDEILATQEINPSFINNDSQTNVRFPSPLVTKPGQLISFSLTVPPELSGNYRAQLSLPNEDSEARNATFYLDNQPQDQNLAFNVSYTFRPPLSYQLGILSLFLAAFLIANLSPKSHAAIIFYAITLTASFISPVVALDSFSPLLLATFIVGFLSMFFFLRSLNLPLPAILLGAHAYSFTTYFPLHILSGRAKLISFAFLPLVFLMFYPSRRFIKKHFKLSGLILIIIFILLIFLPYQPPSIKPIHTAQLKDIFLDPNQTPVSDKFHPAYNALQIPKEDPSVIEYYGGWDNFGSYIGFINLLLALVGIVFTAKRYMPLLAIGVIALVISSTQLLIPSVSIFLPIPPQYLIIIATFILTTFATLGLTRLWRFLGKDPLTNAIIITIVIFALFDLLNVSSKTLQFSLL